ASRLQSAAPPGSVLVGERTMRATRDAVRYEVLEPLVLKGKSEPVAAWEAVGLIAEHPVGRATPTREAPLVGRDFELGALEALDGSGAPGGETAERRAALIGRSLGLDVPQELSPDDSEDPERLRDSLFSALRSTIEAMARRRPLVLAFEDIHWADEGMLDAL